MVSFQCEACCDVIKKPKADAHRSQCHGAYFSCIDCLVTFNGMDYRSHTTCITEKEKYEKPHLQKGKNKNKNLEKIENKSDDKSTHLKNEKKRKHDQIKEENGNKITINKGEENENKLSKKSKKKKSLLEMEKTSIESDPIIWSSKLNQRLIQVIEYILKKQKKPMNLKKLCNKVNSFSKSFELKDKNEFLSFIHKDVFFKHFQMELINEKIQISILPDENQKEKEN